MSGISSGVGLLSGINTAELINQLIELESAPKKLLQQRVAQLEVQRTSFLELSARILSVRSAAARFDERAMFRRYGANSTNNNVLLATAGETALPGSYTFRVHSLVSTYSAISRGFATKTDDPVGAGTLSIEGARARVNPETPLAGLRGGLGVRRGTIEITDRSGATARIDLSVAVTIEDVVDAINNSSNVNVRARLTGLAGANGASGGRIVIEDLSGGQGNLRITDLPGGGIAADLGILTNSAVSRVDGGDMVWLSENTALSQLNDGNGVDRMLVGTDLQFTTTYGDFTVSLSDIPQPNTPLTLLNSGEGVRLGTVKITDRRGVSAEVDLAGAQTLGDVRAALSGTGLSISVALVDSHLQISDTSNLGEDAVTELKVEDVSGSAAADLGIASDAGGSVIVGRELYRVRTLGDVIRAINFAPGNNSFVQASINPTGDGIRLAAFGLGNQVTVTGGTGSSAAKDLGIDDATFDSNTAFDSRPLIAGLSTVLLRTLRGGAGVTTGTVRLTDRAGQTSAINFDGVNTLQDVVDRINQDGVTGIRAEINGVGNGLLLRDTSNGGGTLLVEDVTGTLAADLGVLTSVDNSPASGVIEGANLQRQYIARSTSLDALGAGAPIAGSEFRITDSRGIVFDVSISASARTVGDVINAINQSAPGAIQASINDNGDGIIIRDLSEGNLALTVTDLGGDRAARDLRLLGTASPGERFIDGSFETRIEFGAGDTLNDVVARINALDRGFSASIVNDQAAVNPYRLVITTTTPGRAGELLIDGRSLGFGFNTLTEARDALLSLGSGDPATALLVSSSSNTVTDVVQGVTLDLVSAGSDPVTVTVAQDIDAIVGDIRNFVDAYNSLQSTITDAIRFDPTTLDRGPLLGDNVVNIVRDRLQNTVFRSFDGASNLPGGLVALGLSVGANNQLTFNEERFREVYDSNPTQVEDLFVTADSGFGDVIDSVTDELTRSFDGLLPNKDQLIADQQELLNDQIAVFDIRLAAKRARLEAQFVALEQSLAALQDQQTSLTTLAALAAQRRA